MTTPAEQAAPHWDIAGPDPHRGMAHPYRKATRKVLRSSIPLEATKIGRELIEHEKRRAAHVGSIGARILGEGWES